MPIINKRLPGETNIILSKLVEPFNVRKDTEASMLELQQFLAETSGKLYVIVDCTEFSPDFRDIVIGMAQTSRRDSPVRNSRMETLVVASNKLLEAMVNWFRQQQYGNLDMPLYKSIDDAVAHIKSKMNS